jgi:hypothetical protein
MRRFVVDTVVFIGILVIGLARLPEPFFGDQALNMLMGKIIANGGRPYADVWDLKHPGIFFFFASGGALFGFDEVGIHLFELLWMLALAFAVRIVARKYLHCHLAASFAPVLTVGTYYALTTSYHLTQTEAVVGLPLLVSLVTTVISVDATGRRQFVLLFASGLSAALVFLLKAPYGVLPVIFWWLAAVTSRRRDPAMRVVRHMAPPVLAGLLLPLTAATIYLAWKSDLGLIWWTFVVHPGEAAGRGGVYRQRLTDGVTWFVRTFRVPLALAIVGGWNRLRHERDLLTLGLITWVVAGVLLIWIQVISWWPYHYLLLFVPIGLLATQGVEALWQTATAAATTRRVRVTSVAVLFALSALYIRQVYSIAFVVATVFSSRPLPLTGETMRRYQAAHDPELANAFATTAFLREPGSYPGPIFVFGHPRLYDLAGRWPAIPLVIWGTTPPTGSWNRLMTDLENAAPPYVLVTDRTLRSLLRYDPTLVVEVSALRSRLERRYEPIRTDADGTWYLRRDLAERQRKAESTHATRS